MTIRGGNNGVNWANIVGSLAEETKPNKPNKTTTTANALKVSTKKKKRKKPKKQNTRPIRKHKGIYQRGEKAGELKPGFKYTNKLNSKGQRLIVGSYKSTPFTKINKNGKKVARFAVNKYPTIPRKYQLPLLDVFEDSGFEYIPVDIPTNNKGKEINFDPAKNKNQNIIKVGMSGAKTKGKVGYKLYKLKKGSKILKKDAPSLKSENPYSKLIYLLKTDSEFKDEFKKVGDKKNIKHKELKTVLSEYGIIADDTIAMESVVGGLRDTIEKFNMPIYIIDHNSNKDELYINSNGKRNKLTLTNKQILIVLLGEDNKQLQVTENSLKTMGKVNGIDTIGGEKFKLFRDLYFTKSNKKSVWTFRF